jgi:hypothetical protein
MALVALKTSQPIVEIKQSKRFFKNLAGSKKNQSASQFTQFRLSEKPSTVYYDMHRTKLVSTKTLTFKTGINQA